MQNLQQQLESRTSEHGKLVSLFNTLQRGTDLDATTMLARLRMGASIDELLGMSAGSNPSSMRFVHVYLETVGGH